jgi:hypothetical protein
MASLFQDNKILDCDILAI